MLFKKPKKLRYLFFDFDGTISDAKRLTYETLIQVLDNLDYKYSKSKMKKLMGWRMERILEELKINPNIADNVRKRFYNHLVKDKNLRKLKLCAPIEPLKELRKRGYKLIVISNSESSFLKASAKKLGVKKIFHKIYGADKFKTKDKLLKKLFKKYKIKPKQAAYIGDRFSDIEYAKSAHCISIAIHNACAWSTKKEILSEKPDYIIKDFEDLERLVEKINS